MSKNSQTQKAIYFLRYFFSFFSGSKFKETINEDNLLNETLKKIWWGIKKMYGCRCEHCGNKHYIISDNEVYKLTPESIPSDYAFLLLGRTDHDGDDGLDHVFAIPFGTHKIRINFCDGHSGDDEEEMHEEKCFEFIPGAVYSTWYCGGDQYHKIELPEGSLFYHQKKKEWVTCLTLFQL